MSDKKKGRNYVSLYSDYGLDERQKSISNELGLKSFKVLSIVISLMTLVWLCLHMVEGMPELPRALTEVSFLAAVIVCRCFYAVKASKIGVINQISAFSYTTGGAVLIIILLILTVVFAVAAIIVPSGAQDTWLIAVVFGILAAQNIVLYI